MVGLGFGCALRGFERRVWSVTLWGFFSVIFFPFCVGLSFVFHSFLFFFCLMSSDAKEHNY